MQEDPKQPDEPREDGPEQPVDAPEQPANAPEQPANASEETPAPPAGVGAESGTDEPAVVADGEVESEAAEVAPAPEAAQAEQLPAEAAPAEQPPAEESPAEEALVEDGAAEGDSPGAQAAAAEDEAAGVQEGADTAPRARPEIPGADLEPDIVLEGSDPLGGRSKPEIPGADLEPDIVVDGDDVLVAEEDGAVVPEPAAEDEEPQGIAQAAIDLAAGARYRATGKRKTSIARVVLRPGTGAYTINGRPLDDHFPRPALQRTIRQPLETVGYESRMDVVATLTGGGVSGQAGALRHGIARALIEADPNLRAELKRRGFLTRDARVKERKKAGLKKARKRPQFSKR
jgi:small subunit ribosomal protein S9